MPNDGKTTKAQREKAAHDAAMTPLIREQLETWVAGEYAKKVAYGPACSCGIRHAKCYRHPFVPAGEVS